MADDEESWRQRYREAERINKIEETARGNADAIKAQREDFDKKIDRMAHGLVDQIAGRWEDKTKLFEVEVLGKIDAKLASFGELMVSKQSLPDLVRDALDSALAERRSEVRGNFKFWVSVVLNTISITAAIATAIFWAVNFLKG